VSIDHRAPSGTEALDVRNPATGEVVGRVAVQSAETVAAVVDELRTHQWLFVNESAPVVGVIPGSGSVSFR
jgi:acyl-CoA reductase-like NAD-dependent aldehyde dehydrogenase